MKFAPRLLFPFISAPNIDATSFYNHYFSNLENINLLEDMLLMTLARASFRHLLVAGVGGA